MRVGIMSSLDRRLGLVRWRSLELLLLLLLMLLILMVLMVVHPRGGAVGVMRETMTSLWCRVNGPHCEGFTCLVGAGTLWTAGPHARKWLSLALGVLVREGGMRGVGGAECAA